MNKEIKELLTDRLNRDVVSIIEDSYIEECKKEVRKKFSPKLVKDFKSLTSYKTLTLGAVPDEVFGIGPNTSWRFWYADDLCEYLRFSRLSDHGRCIPCKYCKILMWDWNVVPCPILLERNCTHKPNKHYYAPRTIYEKLAGEFFNSININI